jgi:hypothetical protein
MFLWTVLSLAAILFAADLLPRVVQCKYQLEAITRVAYERANGVACTHERSLYSAIMSPSCADYEAQLEYIWQLSYHTQCTLNSYHFLRSWWFFATLLGLLIYATQLYFNKKVPPGPVYNVLQLPERRGLSIMPQLKE